MSLSHKRSVVNEATPEEIVASYYQQHGYARIPNPTRKAKERHDRYKKGYEIRFCVKNAEELHHLRQALKSLSFTLGNPYPKHARIIQPIYGKVACERLSFLIQGILRDQENLLITATKRMKKRQMGMKKREDAHKTAQDTQTSRKKREEKAKNATR
jgi:hypothetical protein